MLGTNSSIAKRNDERWEKIDISRSITYTRTANPMTCTREIGNIRYSQPNRSDTEVGNEKRNVSEVEQNAPIQMLSVLQVSVKLRAVALTYWVTLRPKKLKKAMETAVAMPVQSTTGLLTVCVHPRFKSKNSDLAAMEGIERKGMRRRTEKNPKNPSHPTATSGATE